MARTRRDRRTLSLPWERAGSLRFGLFSRRRIGALVGLAALLAAVVFAWHTSDERERTRATWSSVGEVRRAVSRFRAEVGRCPRSTLELVHPPRSATRYLREVPTDGWGRPLFVRCPGSAGPDDVDVVSAGPSGDFERDDNVI